jgi:hypothetical protein
MQKMEEVIINPGDFVELRGRPWLVEELRGEPVRRKRVTGELCPTRAGARLPLLWAGHTNPWKLLDN